MLLLEIILLFFDSDDYIDTRLFEELYTVIISDNPDLIEFGHHDVDRQGNITKTFIPKTPLEKYEGDEVLSKFLPELICTDPKTGTASDLLMSAWSCYIEDNYWQNATSILSPKESILVKMCIR